MSESQEIDVNLLYSIVQRETENESVQELDQNLYQTISNFIGKLNRQEYDGIEAKLKEAYVRLISELTELLLRIRLEKASSTDPIDFSNLLAEEKFVIDSEDEIRERKEIILSATLSGKEKLLESISQKHKTKTVVVRFLKEMDEIIGVDLEKYGPFKAEDVATIPYENAQALIIKKIVTKVRWDD